MKKLLLILTGILYLAVPASGAEAVTDGVVYMRQDVFEAQMSAMMSEIRAGNEQIRSDIKVLQARVEALERRIDDVQTTLTTRIDDLQATTTARIEDLKTVVYWGISLLGLFVSFAVLAPSLGEFLRTMRKPSLTVDEVKRLIEEAMIEKGAERN